MSFAILFRGGIVMTATMIIVSRIFRITKKGIFANWPKTSPDKYVNWHSRFVMGFISFGLIGGVCVKGGCVKMIFGSSDVEF